MSVASNGLVVWLGLLAVAAPAGAAPAQTPAAATSPERALLNKYCVTCHNEKAKKGGFAPAGLALDTVNEHDVTADTDIWEKVVRKMRGGIMPPTGRPRPDAAASAAFLTTIQTALDRAAAANPNPGVIPIHRLNRAEYTNTVRDLLNIEVDGASLLPADDSSHGFDNIAGSLALSPSLLERYIMAARRVSRLAVGDPTIGPAFTSKVYPVPMNLYQNDRMSERMPFGSRGGLAIEHDFPLDGEYQIKIRLKRTVYEYVVNLDEPHYLDVRLDRLRLKRFKVGGDAPGKAAPLTFSGTFMAASGIGYPTQEWDDYMTRADEGLELKIPVKAGRREVAVTFVDQLWQKEGIFQPPLREYSATVTERTDSGPRPDGPGIGTVTITGPFEASGAGNTPSRERIFVCRPKGATEEAPCAKKIVSAIARRAYRRPVTDQDLQPILEFYDAGRAAGGFDTGIQRAIQRILVSAEFLFRLERTPAAVEAGASYRLSDVELASRLSYFLWSSMPDDTLLDLAMRGKLQDRLVLDQQVRRMLADPRSQALIDNFFSQWLQVRELKGKTPDPNLFPEFDENLRQDLQQETELFLASQLREDRPAMELLTANYSFLNERLADFYKVPNVFGTRFRRVPLPDDRRGGILGQGSVLTVTSYGNRTSPVLRAKWVLLNILGTPPPDPPANVPPFPAERGADGAPKSVRERLAMHRKNPVCASCHASMDPLGFALENFDAIGQWRTIDAHAPIDASGVLVDGTSFNGPAELRKALLDRREQIIGTMTQSLMTYGLGRGVEAFDQPGIRQIVRGASQADYRWSSLLLGIVNSTPFRMRKAPLRPSGQLAGQSSPRTKKGQ